MPGRAAEGGPCRMPGSNHDGATRAARSLPAASRSKTKKTAGLTLAALGVVYGVVARLALLAASVELEQTDPDQSRYG